jgi:hypothetical protein
MDQMTSEQLKDRAERARNLLSDPMLADALEAVRMDALLSLAEVEPDDMPEILRQQAIVACTGGLVDALMAVILESGAHDGGVEATLN